jgi:4-amino-4-deoxy-L-arabinose transferase-like glycosyltransferase
MRGRGPVRTLRPVGFPRLRLVVARISNSRKSAYTLIAAAVVLPRLIVLVDQRGAILPAFTEGEKSDDIARTFIASGTFGFIPHIPTAYTQPLYSFFLIPLYWAFGRTWEVVGGAQIVVAVATSLIVFEIGRRWLRRWAGLCAALLVSVHPYSLWHDVHINREILDGLLAAAIFMLSLALVDRRSAKTAVALGVVFGLSILSNVRLTALPLFIGVLCLWYWKPSRRSLVAIGAMLAACVVVLLPWVIRNRVQVGCFALTTDSRALWEANNSQTLSTLRRGSWIDNIPLPASFPPSAQDAGREYRRHGKIVRVNECAQVPFFQNKVLSFWVHHPGEKAELAAQGSLMLWNPIVSPPPTRADEVSWLTSLRDTVEPLFMAPIFLLGLYGLFRVPRRVAVLSVILLGYQWGMAIIFVGATRYRVPWDFVAALLAGAALVDLAERLGRRRTRAAALATVPE